MRLRDERVVSSANVRPRSQRRSSVPRPQTAVGNRAFTSWVAEHRRRGSRGPAGRTVTVQRYEAGEHAQWGGGRVIEIKGVKLTEGEVTALAGDLFGSPEATASASSEELTRLRDLVRRDKAAREGRPPKGCLRF